MLQRFKYLISPHVKYINQMATYTNQMVASVRSDATQIKADEREAEQAAVV